MKKRLDIKHWARQDHFNFFRQFEEPFFGVTLNVDCTRAYTKSKEKGASFFLYYLHRSLVAANQTEPFRYRIEHDEVFVFDAVHASPTINRPDGTFGFAYLEYYESFEAFQQEALLRIDQVRNDSGLFPANSGENVIHYSSIPWINFTSISHARSFSFPDSSPKISFGKVTETGGKRSMPVSVHVHHALMDGYHVGQFCEIFQELMNT